MRLAPCFVISMLAERQLPANESPSFAKSTHTYKTAGDVKIDADVYRLDDAKPRPVLLWIHGGALVMGSRGQVPKELLDLCQTAGYCLVSIDYRLAPQVKLPAIIDDLRDALRWIREQGPKLFHAQPAKLVVAGGSAGGYLALMTGAVAEPKPSAIVAYWGYGDVDGDWYTQPSEHYRKSHPLVTEEEARKGAGAQLLTAADGKELVSARALYYLYLRQNGLWTREVAGFDSVKEARQLDPYCPVRNVTPEYPPTVLVHGTEDTDVPHDRSVLMAAALRQHKVAHELISVRGAGHGLGGGDKEEEAKARSQALAFIRKHLD